MSTQETKAPIDIVGLRERLSILTYDKLKEEAGVLGVSEVWKGGVNKQTAVENIIKAYVEKNTVVETPVDQKPEEPVLGAEQEESTDEIPEGEYDVDEETLIDYPQLIEMGFSIGDVLVVEIGKPWSKKVLEEQVGNEEEEIINSFEEYLTSNLRRQSYIDNPNFPNQELLEERLSTVNDADTDQWRRYLESKGLIPNVETEHVDSQEEVKEIEVVDEEEVGEYVPEIIDETKFTEEELQENIDICQANCNQALPATRIFLLRKIDALQSALDRKQK